ncbi:lipopolysaccharide biosynthesis protein [Georgenia sp. Marseille-Q6866]
MTEKRNSYTVVLASRVASAALTAVALALLGRSAGPAEFGTFAAILAVVTAVTTLSDRGYQTLAVRLHARTELRDDSMSTMSLQRRQTTAVSVAQAAALSVATWSGWLPAWSVLMVGWQWFEKEIRGGLGIALAEGRSTLQLAILAGNRFAALVLFLVAMLVMDPVVAFLASATVVASVTLWLLYRRLPSYGRRSSTLLDRDMRVRARHYWVASMSAQVRSMDVTLVSLFSSPLQAGLFSLPSRVSAPLKIAASSLSNVALPAASRHDHAELRALRTVVIRVTVLSTAGLALIGVLAEPLVVFVVGEQYLGSVTPLRILLVGLAVNIPGSYLSGVMQGLGHERDIARLGVILAATTLVLVPIGAVLWGANGAAVGITVVYLLQFLLVLLLKKRYS